MRTSSRFLSSLAIAVVAALSAGAAQAQVVAFGASNTSGANLSDDQTYPALLQAMLRQKGYSATVTNAGVYGNTTAQMRERLDSDIPAGTKIVVLDMSGGVYNDTFHGGSVAKGVAAMHAMAAELRRRGIVVIPESSAQMPKKLKQRDGVHLTAEGQQRMAAYLFPLVARALGRPN
jgi:acyl-CoA thioesterase I